MQMTLEQLRTTRGPTQTELAQTLRINQSGLSKLERRPDMYVSMLRSFVQALGGRLEIRAIFPKEEPIGIAGLDGSGTLADLQALINHLCKIEPIPPDHLYNRFLLREVNESIVTFEKQSNKQYLYVPTRRISEVLPATPDSMPVVLLKGSLSWSGQKKLWQFDLK
jgi:transcriptional regulator with XRE-family HTH domain